MRVKFLFTLLAGVLSMSSFFAEEDAKSVQTPKTSTGRITSEQRETMANMHDKMSTCLRSDKPISACHKEMRTDCQAMVDG
jgi:putative SOS response-associated peptidase YedK